MFSPRSTGSWQPLPYMYSGVVVYPYHPSPTPLSSPVAATSPTKAHRNRFSWSGLPESSRGDDVERGGKDNPYEIPLDIGDEFFAFEEYRCTMEEDGKGDVWYRGYISQATSLLSLMPNNTASTSKTLIYPRPEPAVLIGIFPASVVRIRPNASSDDGTLSAAYEKAVRLVEERARNPGLGVFGDMKPVKEEEEEDGAVDHANSPAIRLSTKIPIHLGVNGMTTGIIEISQENPSEPPSVGRIRSMSRPNRPRSLLLDRRKTMPPEPEKEEPPLPQLTAGDSTIAGQHWPLVDEISCAIREWFQRLPTYLANREYRLFNTVMQHVDALLLGRRQLLSQTLSEDELTRIRQECVSRLVKCNVAQGLDVIVRSLEDGGVMVFDRSRATGSNWIDGITCYVYQVRLAYIDLIPLDTLFSKTSSLGLPKNTHTSSLTTRFSLQEMKSGTTPTSLGDKLFHCLLDVRAFVASPCAPGETAELYFSLYNNAERRFVTEEFCLILNHLGSPARDPEIRIGRLRTLFTDLKHEDLVGQVYLVCRIVRNGSMKMRAEASSGAMDSIRRSSIMSRGKGTQASDMGTTRNRPLSTVDDLTDDSFSVTSGYGGQRTETVDTHTPTITTNVEGKPTFRRPLGCAVLPLPQLSTLMSEGGDKSGAGIEFVMPIYVPKEEVLFANLHEAIIDQQTKDYTHNARYVIPLSSLGIFELTSRAEAVAISLKVFQGAASQITRENPSLLLDIPHTARLGFPDVVHPGQSRNDLYVKLWSASFVPNPANTGGSLRMRKAVLPINHGNVQITVEVRRADGTVIPDALHPGGSGEPPVVQFNSLVFQNNDQPTYGELLKISLPARVNDCHLFLTFRSRSKSPLHAGEEPEKAFAFAFLPLIGETMCIKDGLHELVLYRMEKGLQPAPNLYYTAPPTGADDPALSTQTAKTMTPLRDRVMLRSYLCSSIHTQDDTLRSLFAWQTLSSDIQGLLDTLRTFGFVNEEEISKFIPTVLDSLFGILVSNLGEQQREVDDLVFQGLIKVLSMITDRRFTSFGEVLDLYLAQHFNHPASSFHLLRSMKAIMSQPDTQAYRSLLKVWHLFFRFIIRSRELDRTRGIGLDATSAHIEADFRRQVKALLSELNTLMANTNKSVIGTQTLAVQHYADILPGLMRVFPPLEIAEMVISFADTLAHATGSIVIYKLLLLRQVLKVLFDTSESRALLTPAIVRWVKPHLGKYEEGLRLGQDETQIARDTRRMKWLECNRLAVTVVAWTVNKLQEWLVSPLIEDEEVARAQEQDNLEYCLTLIPSLLASYSDLATITTSEAITRHRLTSNIWKPVPDVFPSSQPFCLISQLPPPSLLNSTQTGDDLPSSSPFNPSLGETCVVILSLILASPSRNILAWLTEVLDIDGAEGTSSLLLRIFAFGTSVVRFDAFPSQWLTLRLMTFSSIIKWIDVIAVLLEKEDFIPPVERTEEFDVKLWMGCFDLLCDICGNEELALEEHTQQRRRAEWIIAGDMRDEAAALLLKLWNALGWPIDGKALRYGGYQTRFTGLAEKILGLCLSSHDLMTETAVEILYSMIYAEYSLYGKFDTIQNEIFAKLDVLFMAKTASPSDGALRAYFITRLRAIFETSPSPDPQFRTSVSTFLDEVELFIDLLLSVRDLSQEVEWAEERCAATYRLMEFIKRMGRDDLYARFVYQLVNICLEGRNLVGAGLALKLHAEMYDWDMDGELLEGLNNDVVDLPDHFEAEAYELALQLCSELTTEHEKLAYDIKKLTALFKHQSKLWARIGESSRPQPEYYRVAFYGEEFSALNRGKDFVYRGQPYQRYGEFCESIQHKYPNASIHRSKVSPSTTANEQGGVIWITPLTPEPDLSLPVFKDRVQGNVQAWHRYNGVNRFSSLRPFVPASQADEGDEGKEAVMTWMEKTIVTTAEVFPSILTRSEITLTTYEHLSPITIAISEVIKASQSLRQLAHPPPGMNIDVKHLGTTINGAVDSPTFLDPAFLEKNPDEKDKVFELGNSIVGYARTIQDALIVHRTVCKDLAFHEALHSRQYLLNLSSHTRFLVSC
ncbi:hypothetical protein TREMEDRAFT_25841 [Tremella mesenterica DSM 1558]|uniref:uncharacterized protein n=1 Tax=Tremella mesenterica (strain ATCC 24925 / CBS 8224 / DSM 1558 / NBRC 9311 / NRRL Y-6157 / RJB 2259-6 / UBC 559-6) TaxID=578456 RepID=UPI0003F48FA8|nr:uncharacterized protein TREMEDRAFT_25841 [Tremella mesenterica DSM 1558]EIW72245.1 hypothetical protein TREMEDRAFT_25841 [Tremella mesenterica DSM 1558]